MNKKTAATTPLLTIPFAIPAYWTPEQALAVFELLDELRDAIAARYAVQLFEHARDTYQHTPVDKPLPDADESPF
jgi:hypothetical protein